MKKTIALIIPIFFLLSCNQAKNKNKEKRNQTVTKDTISEIVELAIKPNTFKLSSLPGTVKVQMGNNTTDTITTGDYYRIEKLEENEWTNVSPKDMTFYDIGYDLKPFDNKTFEEKLLKNKINYNSGKYRIVKNYVKPDYQKTRENFYVYAEFDIQ